LDFRSLVLKEDAKWKEIAKKSVFAGPSKDKNRILCKRRKADLLRKGIQFGAPSRRWKNRGTTRKKKGREFWKLG